MNDFIIMTDSCCDLPAQLADKLELTVLPLSFTINGKEHYNYLDGRDISSSHFYRLNAMYHFCGKHECVSLCHGAGSEKR